MQHITGTAAFSRCVGPGVFIPRPETEALLEWALAQSLPADPLIVDRAPVPVRWRSRWLATTRARVIAVDDDGAALAYARRNAESLRRWELVEADVTAGLLPELTGTVDLVVANPPYIPAGAELEPEVAQHDPAHALFGGADGHGRHRTDRRPCGRVAGERAACWPSSTTTPRRLRPSK